MRFNSSFFNLFTFNKRVLNLAGSVLWLAVRRWCHTFTCTLSIISGSSLSWLRKMMISIMVTIKPDWGGLVLSTLNLLIYHHSTGPRYISNVFKSIKRFCVFARLVGDCINSERAAESPEAAGRSVALLFNLILNLRRATDERCPLSCVSLSHQRRHGFSRKPGSQPRGFFRRGSCFQSGVPGRESVASRRRSGTEQPENVQEHRPRGFTGVTSPLWDDLERSLALSRARVPLWDDICTFLFLQTNLQQLVALRNCRVWH